MPTCRICGKSGLFLYLDDNGRCAYCCAPVAHGHKSTIDRPDKGESLLEARDNYVVIDLETTGLSPSSDEIIEFGAVLVENGRVVAEFSSLANPGHEIDPQIVRLTGITNSALSKARPVKDVLYDFLHFVADHPIVGHNVGFDVNFLYDSAMRHFGHGIDNDWIDTMRLARRSVHSVSNHKLATLLNHYGIENKNAHRACSDARCAHELYEILKRFILWNDVLPESCAFGGYSYDCVFASILHMVGYDEANVTLKLNKNYASIYMYGTVAFTVRINTRSRLLECDIPAALEYVDRIPGASISAVGSARFPIATGKETVAIVADMVKAVYDSLSSSTKGDSFGCCSDFVRCSDALCCLKNDNPAYRGCAYRKNLEAGRVFYGKNKNI